MLLSKRAHVLHQPDLEVTRNRQVALRGAVLAHDRASLTLGDLVPAYQKATASRRRIGLTIFRLQSFSIGISEA
jgi:hypothetical protein